MPKPTRGILDTSAVIDLGQIDEDSLPDEFAITAITLAELAAGPHATADPLERARRQDVLSRQIYAAVAAAERKPRGRRAVDVLIAATASAADLPVAILRTSAGGCNGRIHTGRKEFLRSTFAMK